MHERVATGRHGSVGYGFGGVLTVLALRSPLGKVEFVTTGVDIPSHQPRHRGDIGVRWPARLVAVAVIASDPRLRRGGVVGPRRLAHDRWVAVLPSIWNELDQQAGGGDNHQPAQNDTAEARASHRATIAARRYSSR